MWEFKMIGWYGQVMFNYEILIFSFELSVANIFALTCKKGSGIQQLVIDFKFLLSYIYIFFFN